MRHLFITAVLVMLFSLPAYAGETVRVLVMDDVARLAVVFPPDMDVRDITGQGVLAQDAEGARLTLDSAHAPSGGVSIKAGGSVIEINEFSLTGTVEVTPNGKGRFRIVNELGIEEYTAAVVGQEMGPSWPIEALKAQAVVTRTYALFRKYRGGVCPDYDLCASVNSQVFTGGAKAKEGPAEAARQTEGLVLAYGGSLAETLYHASCGGKTEDASAVWDRPSPYLVSANCGCGEASPYARWTRSITAEALAGALRSDGHQCREVESVEVTSRSATGRARQVRVATDAGALTLSGNEFRRVTGYSKLPSTWFVVDRSGGSYVFTGSGSGHGVGLCQFGAKAMAEDGADFREILAHYYPRLTLSALAGRDGGGGGD